MGMFQLAKVRLGATWLLLEDLKGESRRAASLLQSNALLEVLLSESRRKDLGAEMRASLGTAICAAKFEEDTRLPFWPLCRVRKSRASGKRKMR